MKLFQLALLSLCLFPLQSVSAQKHEVFSEIRAKDDINIAPDKAYLLIRLRSKARGAPIFMRIPTAAEIEAYDSAKTASFEKDLPDLTSSWKKAVAKAEANKAKGRNAVTPPEPSLENYNFVYEEGANIEGINYGRTLEKTKEIRTYLVEAEPGEYIYFGVGAERGLHTCLCLGTVSFKANPGEITDLGEILVDIGWRLSKFPELAPHTNLGASVNGHWIMWSTALRPASDTMSMPAKLNGQKNVRAEFNPVGRYVTPMAFNINRLAPVPGLLAYDEGKVIDARTNEVVPNNY